MILRSWNQLTEPKELNAGTCPVCGAKQGQTCFILGGRSGRRFLELAKVHVPENKMSVR
jgi:hypothetical protein